jgi:hypothetical protein
MQDDEEKSVTVEVPSVGATADAYAPTVLIEKRVSELERNTQVLEKLVNENTKWLQDAAKWRWITLIIAVIAIILSIVPKPA